LQQHSEKEEKKFLKEKMQFFLKKDFENRIITNTVPSMAWGPGPVLINFLLL
jgi:hypothetical protein